jgi:hypothetical protein
MFYHTNWADSTLLSFQRLMLNRLGSPYPMSGDERIITIDSTMLRFNPDMPKWHHASVISFCFTAHLMAFDRPNIRCGSACDHSWTLQLPLAFYRLGDIQEMQNDTNDILQQQLLYAVHTIVNSVVGQFYITLMTCLRGDFRFYQPWDPGLNLFPPETQPKPPTIWQIPLSTFMNPPRPLLKSTPELFVLSHLEIMANPDFLADGDWTGYLASLYTIPGQTQHLHLPFSAVGANLESQRVKNSRNLPEGNTMEGTVRFSLKEVLNSGEFVMRSNIFTLGANTCAIDLRISPEKGFITVTSWLNGSGSTFFHASGAVTPFGIVICDHIALDWLWFWKRSWSSELVEPFVR